MANDPVDTGRSTKARKRAKRAAQSRPAGEQLSSNTKAPDNQMHVASKDPNSTGLLAVAPLTGLSIDLMDTAAALPAEDLEGLLVVAPSTALTIDLNDTAAALPAEDPEGSRRLRLGQSFDRPQRYGGCASGRESRGLQAVAPWSVF